MTPTGKRLLDTLPNLLTLSRLVLTPVVCGLIGFGFYLSAAAALMVASITDWLDGYLARRLGVASALGRQLDPLVDKVIVAGCFIFLLAVPEDTGLYAWMVTVLIARELIVQTLRSLIEGRGEPFGAKMADKLKTTFQFLALLAILIVLAWDLTGAWLWVRDVLIWLAVGLTIYSGWGYIVLAWPKLGGDPESTTTTTASERS